MNQETITGVQKTAGWLTVGGGFLPWVTQNATALTALASIATGLVFATCAIWNLTVNHRNAKANEARVKASKRDITTGILESLENDLSQEEIEKIKRSLRK